MSKHNYVIIILVIISLGMMVAGFYNTIQKFKVTHNYYSSAEENEDDE